jgi:hypothetical protein
MIKDFPIDLQPYALGLIVALILWGACAVGWRGLKKLENE